MPEVRPPYNVILDGSPDASADLFLAIPDAIRRLKETQMVKANVVAAHDTSLHEPLEMERATDHQQAAAKNSFPRNQGGSPLSTKQLITCSEYYEQSRLSKV